MARSKEPIFWSLFSAGGVFSAFFVPVHLLLFGILCPLAIVKGVYTYAHLKPMITHPIGRLYLFGLITLCLFHAGHRLRFALVDLGQGCNGCSLPVQVVGTIAVDRSGDDVVLDWSADPVSATRYIVYKLGGPTFADAVAVGTTDTKSFVHQGAISSAESFSYRVTSVDACANESAL